MGSTAEVSCLTVLEAKGSKIKVSASLVAVESSLPSLQALPSRWVLTGQRHTEIFLPSLEGHSPIRLEPTLTISFNLNDLFKALFPNTATLGIKALTYEFGGST